MIYLHVPFCESFCTYCGFFSVVPESDVAAKAPAASLPLCGPNRVNGRRSGPLSLRETLFKAYAEAVLKEIESRRDEIAATLSVNTLYIGGGTPSVLPLDVLSRIVTALCPQPEGAMTPNPPRSALRPVSPAASHPFMRPRAATGSAAIPLPADSSRSLSGVEGPAYHNWDEFTVEVNPEDIVEKGEEYVRALIGLGVNRISMGIQSFDDGILHWMNRRHDAAGAEEAFRILRRCGVGNISLDLIFGLSQLDDSAWAATIDRTLALGPEHISAYQLSVEEDSALEKLIAKGKYVEASDEQCRWQYDMLCFRLREAGYRHYEISNFALPGREAVHNSAYWRRVPYVGLGPGAHSLSVPSVDIDTPSAVDAESRSIPSVRSWNSQEIPRRLRDGNLATYSREEEVLTPEDIRIERIMLPLRTDLGMPEEELRSLAGHESVDRLLSEGALVRSPGGIRIPEDHFFTSDEIIRELI